MKAASGTGKETLQRVKEAYVDEVHVSHQLLAPERMEELYSEWIGAAPYDESVLSPELHTSYHFIEKSDSMIIASEW